MTELFPPTLDDEIACVRREIQYRERVYPRWVAEGKMKPDAADRQLALMRAVLGRLNGLKAG